MAQVIGTSPLTLMATPTEGFSVIVTEKASSTRKTNSGKLNLVSLMDIFTILVFFLMLNSGDVEILQPDESIQLPQSTAALKPNEVPVIKLTNDSILFSGKVLVAIDALSEGKGVPQLEQALMAFDAAEEARKIDHSEQKKIKGVSIMSDGSVNYSVLKRVLYSSAQAGYRDIGLATEYIQTDAPTAKQG